MNSDFYRQSVEEAVDFYDEELGLDYFEQFLGDGYVLEVYGLDHLRPELRRGVEEIDPEDFLEGMTVEFQGYRQGEDLDHSFYQALVNGGIEIFMPPANCFAVEFDEAPATEEFYRSVNGKDVNPQLKYDDGFQTVFFTDGGTEEFEEILADRFPEAALVDSYPGVRAPFSLDGDTLFDEVEHSLVSVPLEPGELSGFERDDAVLKEVRGELEERKEVFRYQLTDLDSLRNAII